MPLLRTISLDGYGVGRKKTEPLNIWYGQPVLAFPDVAPFVPLTTAYPSGLQILKGILEHQEIVQAGALPAIVALPELAIPFQDIAAARTLITDAPKGTIVVFGVGQMTAEEALSLENEPELWEGEAAGRFANCAVVAIGGTDRLFLQPKLHRSAFEQDTHWPGRVVRCFTGTYLRFTTFICSDLLNRPGATSHLEWLHDELEKAQHKLTFALWLQHNPKPRSSQFSNSIETIARMDRPTMIVVGSRMASGGKRYENFAVSGALVPRSVLPSEFGKFTHRFHYVEQASAEVSRAVLLRYDADAYRVKTVLADVLDAADRAEKGELFDSSQPYVLANGTLTASSTDIHIKDICGPARQAVASRSAGLAQALAVCLDRLALLGTSRCLAFLDAGIVPQPQDGSRPHLAGIRHDGGDLLCRCWRHRICLDLLTDSDGIRPLAALLESLALLESAACAPTPRYDSQRRTNVDVSVEGTSLPATLVYPFDYSLEALQQKLFGDRPPVSEVHVILVADLASQRPPVETINVAEAPSSGALDPAKASSPTLSALRSADLKAAVASGSLPGILTRMLGRNAH